MDNSNSYPPHFISHQFQNFLYPQPQNPPSNPNPNPITTIPPNSDQHQHHSMTTDAFPAFHLQNPNPTPPPHPPYPEMIKAAIGALNGGPGGGMGLSKQAISKHIEKTYGRLLPDNHADQLAVSLQGLKNSGEVVMVKHSYKLPGSDDSVGITAAVAVAQPTPTFTGTGSVTVAVAPSGGNGGGGASSHRKRGRPRKYMPPSTEPDTVMISESGTGVVAVNQPVNGVVAAVNENATGTAAVNENATRAAVNDSVAKVAGESGNNAVVNGVVGETVNEGSVVPKKRLGRPPKVRFEAGEEVNGVVQSSEKKSKGRPKRIVKQVALGGPKGTPSPGRPTKSRAVADVINGPVQTLAVAGTKRRGWPKGLPRGSKATKVQKWVGPSSQVGAGLVGTRSLGPVEPQWMVDYAHIRAKFEYIQSKMKKAIGVIKPHVMDQITTNGDVSAAMQELDQISSMDVMAVSLNVTNEEPKAM